jgi:hypothetical protein
MGKADRRAYRLGIAGTKTDRFAELMAGIDGTLACLGCTRVVAVAVLQNGLCPPCRRIPSAPRVVKLDLDVEEGMVYVDASYRDGVAGIAVIGALGTHSRRLECLSNVEAEIEAMRWALRLAKHRRVVEMTFRTDSQSAARFEHNATPRWASWVVEWVPRYRNQKADRLSRRARLRV